MYVNRFIQYLHAFQLRGERLTESLSQELGRTLKQEELDLLHYPRICGECGWGGAVQVGLRGGWRGLGRSGRSQGSVEGAGQVR